MSQPVRHFITCDGAFYCVRLTPHERAGGRGLSPLQRSLCFETAEGRWIGSVPICHGWGLDELTHDDLVELLEQAIGRG